MSKSSRRTAFTSAATAAGAEGPASLMARISAFPRLVRDVATGRFVEVSRGRLLLMGLAVLYIVSPVDLVPEVFLTLPGLVDDVAVAGWLVSSALGATAAYLAWEGSGPGAARSTSGDPRVVPGEVVTP
jgi:uncharacterized membrane protein YkvA (DUF1232 family)